MIKDTTTHISTANDQLNKFVIHQQLNMRKEVGNDTK